MSNHLDITIVTAQLLLDRHYRLVELSDHGGFFKPSGLSPGTDMRRCWRNFDDWLHDHRDTLPDTNDFGQCMPGMLASLKILGDSYRLLNIWRQTDIVKSSLSRVRSCALMFDARRSLVYANPAAEQFYQKQGLSGWQPLLPDEFESQWSTWMKRGQPVRLESRLDEQYYRWDINPDPEGHYAVLLFHPMEDRENYRRILEYSVDGMYQTSRQGQLIYANHSLATLFGYQSPAEMKRSVSRVEHSLYRRKEDRYRFVERLEQDNEVLGFECEMVRKDGHTIWVRQNARAVNDSDGRLQHIVGTVADVTALKLAEQARQQAENNYRELFNNAQAGLYRATGRGQGRFINVNNMLTRMLGFDNRRQCLDHYSELGRQLWVDTRERERFLTKLQRQQWVSNHRAEIKRRDGSRLWVQINARCTHLSQRDEEVVEGSMFDITEQVRAENEIRHLAEHDPLTNLPNRSRFQHEVERLIDRGPGYSHRDFLVIFLDLDHFKDINDTLGHLVGDALLKEIARRLNQPLNALYQTYRLGGDEFAIVIDSYLTDAQLDVLCRQICVRVGQGFLYQENHLKVSASLGVVRASQLALSQSDSPLEDIMRAADLALYSCKRTGRNSYHLYRESMRLRLQAEKELEGRLAIALEEDRLQLHYQPVFDCASGRIRGAEALLRWPVDPDDPDQGMISPAQFIPLAERCGLIADIDAWVLNQILTQCESLAERFPDLIFSFNLSAHHFNFDSFGELIAPLEDRIRRWGRNMALELTERVMFENADRVIRSLNHLRQLGVTISLDDFGTGYSSLSYLTQFPVDRIKIDQSFIQDMLGNSTAMAVVQAAAQIGKTLQLAITAEGIETREQYDYVRSLNIDEGQGFFLGRPMPLRELLNRLEADDGITPTPAKAPLPSSGFRPPG